VWGPSSGLLIDAMLIRHPEEGWLTSAEEIMQILEADDLTGSYRDAAERGKVRADVVRDKLIALGYQGFGAHHPAGGGEGGVARLLSRRCAQASIGERDAKAQVRRPMWARWGSNPRPIDYESTALTTELRALSVGA
jgi:hypothetical protein